MPAVSEKQKLHLQRLNSFPQTEVNRFAKGHIPSNKKRESRKDLCPICKVNIKSVYYSQCKPCSYKQRSESQITRIWKSGYVYSECGSRPRPEHVVIAEKLLGRKIKSTECVHHINLHRNDNRNCNLLLCDKKYHAWLHGQYAKKFAERSFDYVSSSV